MDLSQSIEPNSAQVNAEDFLSGARTVTITSVEAGTSEQPVFIHTREFEGRTWRPSKTMRRVLVEAWGKDSSVYVGRRARLYRNPDVKFGGAAVGGIQIEALSNIDKPLSVALMVTRGKRAPFVVQPLPDAAPQRDWLAELEQTEGDIDLISALGKAAKQAGAHPSIMAKLTAAYQEAKGNS